MARKASAADDVASCGSVVDYPTPSDVILGRGRAHENHEGNRHYQALIDLYYDHYINAKLNMKTEISTTIVDAVLHRGRFLKKEKIQGKWITISKKEARVKVAHCFQYRRRRSSLSVSESDSDSLREDDEEDGNNSLKQAFEEALLGTKPSDVGLDSSAFLFLAAKPRSELESPLGCHENASLHSCGIDTVGNILNYTEDELDLLEGNLMDIEQEELNDLIVEGLAFGDDLCNIWDVL